MDGRKVCKGCSAVVVKPIGCPGCDVAAHPACLTRSGHVHANGQFVDCREPTPITVTTIKELLRDEFLTFRKEMRDMYRADMEMIKNDIKGLTGRIELLENSLASFQFKGVSPSLENEVLEELEERERRSTNLVLFNLEESEGERCLDVDLAVDILQRILPEEIFEVKTERLGRKRQGQPRPLRVTLPSRSKVAAVLRNKFRYSGPVRVSQDQTVKQRSHFKELQMQLKAMRDAGDEHKTIRFKNGIPKIVDAKRSSNVKKTNSLPFSILSKCAWS